MCCRVAHRDRPHPSGNHPAAHRTTAQQHTKERSHPRGNHPNHHAPQSSTQGITPPQRETPHSPCTPEDSLSAHTGLGAGGNGSRAGKGFRSWSRGLTSFGTHEDRHPIYSLHAFRPPLPIRLPYCCPRVMSPLALHALMPHVYKVCSTNWASGRYVNTKSKM